MTSSLDKEGRGQDDSSGSTGVRRRGYVSMGLRKSEELRDAEASGREQIHRSTCDRASPVVSHLYAHIDKSRLTNSYSGSPSSSTGSQDSASHPAVPRLARAMRPRHPSRSSWPTT